MRLLFILVIVLDIFYCLNVLLFYNLFIIIVNYYILCLLNDFFGYRLGLILIYDLFDIWLFLY